MSAHRSRRIDRHTAEQLLRGEPGVRTGPDALSGLLSAAKAPATGGELAGEETAVMAFRAARPGPAPRTRRRSVIGMLTVKVAAAAAGAVAVGGVAFAATTGVLPANPGDDVSRPSPAPASHTMPVPSVPPSSARSLPGQGTSTPPPLPSGASAGVPGQGNGRGKPEKPPHPTHPTHPVHPTHPAHPVHP
ncbi:hypothetical protein [Amycolatopsis sp. GM8]|uniref:hypothetical protein n=1 Tax=Amycolatopsis sp. GM8 TaxID=2896530 RepID=UPI001F208D74|nr:hypothetical protein [Amycolatopsis sp. GM8]